jgi:Rrf2 family transcriptional regulator, iron-sulfur cluster assembly transcription factor
MLSNSCRYGIRAVIYLANQKKPKTKIGIKQISTDLNLPTPFLAKILQQLAKQKILNSTKGPHGGFSLLRDPQKITLLDIVKTIDGEDIFNNCVVHLNSCKCVEESQEKCALHDDYAKVREGMIDLFGKNTIYDIVKKACDSEKVFI